MLRARNCDCKKWGKKELSEKWPTGRKLEMLIDFLVQVNSYILGWPLENELKKFTKGWLRRYYWLFFAIFNLFTSSDSLNTYFYVILW